MRSIEFQRFLIPFTLVVTHHFVSKVAARPQVAVYVDPTLSMARSADLTGADLLSMINRSIGDFYNFFAFK